MKFKVTASFYAQSGNMGNPVSTSIDFDVEAYSEEDARQAVWETCTQWGWFSIDIEVKKYSEGEIHE